MTVTNTAHATAKRSNPVRWYGANVPTITETTGVQLVARMVDGADREDW